MTTFGDRLKHLREQRNWTLGDVATKLGLKGHSTYSNWEYDNRQPDNEMLCRLADLFEVTTDYLLGRSDLPHLTESESKSLRSLRDIRDETARNLILDVDGTPFTPERKEEVLRQIDLLIRLREVEGYKK